VSVVCVGHWGTSDSESTLCEALGH